MSEPWSRDPLHDRPLPADAASERPRYRPPIGVPAPKRSTWQSTLLSIAFHALIIALIIAPIVVSELRLEEIEGAGGDGPAGGGGGGRRGNGLGVTERLHYVPVPPVPPAPAAVAPPATATPVPPPVPPPVQPPVPPKQEQPQPVPPPVEPTPAPQQTASVAPAPTPGAGTGGTGTDGTAGSGPGSGGGVGAGVGTGRGSGVGPGTGGGNNTVYPPQPTELFIPPLPVPDRVKGTQLVAVFEVDSTGRVLKFDFTPTRDGGYNRKLRDVLASIRFRPGTRSDGTPIRAQGSVTYLF